MVSIFFSTSFSTESHRVLSISQFITHVFCSQNCLSLNSSSNSCFPPSLDSIISKTNTCSSNRTAFERMAVKKYLSSLQQNPTNSHYYQHHHGLGQNRSNFLNSLLNHEKNCCTGLGSATRRLAQPVSLDRVARSHRNAAGTLYSFILYEKLFIIMVLL